MVNREISFFYNLSTAAQVIDFLYFPEWTPASPIELAQAGELLFQVR